MTTYPRSYGAARAWRDARPNGRQTDRMRATDDGRPDGLGQGLGWFSIGLGIAQIAAPERVAALIGISDDEANLTLLRTIGLREIASGVGILTSANPANWLMARVGGDLMDLALLTGALNSDRVQRDRDKLLATAAATAGFTALDFLVSQQHSRQTHDGWERRDNKGEERGERITKATTINRSPSDVYRFFRNFENLPRFMRHLEAIEVLDDRRSHWTAKAPAGMSVEWDAEIAQDVPNEYIAWRSLPGATVENWGGVRFTPAPGDRGTEVRVEMSYAPPLGTVGATLLKLFAENPGRQIQEDLRVFKQVLETGEVVWSDGSVEGGRFQMQAGQPPARPVRQGQMVRQ